MKGIQKSIEEVTEELLYSFDIFFLDGTVYRIEIPAKHYNHVTSECIHHCLASGLNPESRDPFEKEVFGYQFCNGFEYYSFQLVLSLPSLDRPVVPDAS